MDKNINNQFYLLREREFIKLNEQVYKIGRTNQQFLTRMNGYPKGSQVVFMSLVSNCYTLEETIKKIFTQKFIKRKDIGNEYFEGDVNEMLKIIREQINLQMYNDIIDVNPIVYEDIKPEINCITENIKKLNNKEVNIELDEELKLINNCNKAYSMLKVILDDKENLKKITAMSHKDALARAAYKQMTCDSTEPEIIKMYNEINTCNYILYDLILNCFDELKIIAYQ
jgi:hypothetical protein